MKNKFISMLLLLVTTMVVIYSCRNNESLIENETYNNNNQFQLKAKTIRLDQSKHKLILNTELQKVKTSLQKIKITGKTDYSNNVFIDTDNVTYIENGPNFHTYTFNLIRENAPADAPIENLVLAPRADGTYKEILVTYNLTAQEKQSILNGENVSTKGKSYIMELSDNTFNPIASKSQNCSWVEADSYTWCSEGVHHNGEGSGTCTAGVKSQLIKVMLLKCESIDDGSGNTGGGGTGGTGGGGGGSTGDGTGSGSGGGTPTEPCNGNGVATGPLEPSTDIGDGTNCSGIPTIPTLPLDKKTPCEKTRAIYNNTAVKSRYEILKGKTSEPNESGYGFKTVPDGNGGTTTQTNPLNPDANPDKMKVGIYPTSYGYIHTHLDKADGKMAVKIFSPADINTFLAFLHNAQTNGIPFGSIFGGMIASDPDTGHNIYQMIYTGDGTDLPAELTDDQLKVLKNKYIKEAQDMANNNEGILSHSDMQKLFYATLKKINIKNVVLSKIEYNTTTYKVVNFDTNGNPIEETCP